MASKSQLELWSYLNEFKNGELLSAFSWIVRNDTDAVVSRAATTAFIPLLWHPEWGFASDIQSEHNENPFPKNGEQIHM